MGFKGIVCSVIKEPTLQAKGEVSVRRVSVDEHGNTVQIPDSVWIYGKEYYVTNVETDAIPSIFETEDSQEENPAEAGAGDYGSQGSEASDSDVPGSESTEENGLEEKDSQNSQESISDNVVISKQGNLAVKVNKKSWKEDYGIYADMTTDGSKYQLVISEAENDEVKEALSREGINADDFQLVPFELKLIEVSSQIPISRLGSECVTVSLPVSKVYKEQPVVAVGLDESGQLEYISCIHHTEGDKEYVLFEAKHFSPYALLCGEKVPAEYQNAYFDKVEAKKAANYSDKYGKKDESPDTGDYVHPKWILAAGLVLLAFYLGLRKAKLDTSLVIHLKAVTYIVTCKWVETRRYLPVWNQGKNLKFILTLVNVQTVKYILV